MFKLSEPRKVQRFDGSEIVFEKYSEVEFILSRIQKLKVKLLIHEEPNKVLLGTDFLEKFDYKIESEFLYLNGIKHPRFKLHEDIIKNLLKNFNGSN